MKAEWTSYQDRLNRVTAYIYDHLDDDLDMMRLADVAALSPYHWHRIYYAVRGETVVAAVKRLRLQRAAVDLAQTSLSIEQVSSRAGYGSVPAFTRAFGESYGMPPAQYRKQGSHADFVPGRLVPPNGEYSVEIRNLPVTCAATLDHRGSYMEIGRTFEALFGHLARQNLLTGAVQMIAVYPDDPTVVPEADLRSKAGVFLQSGVETAAPLETIALAGGDYAVLTHKGPYADMKPAYTWLFGTWLPQSGREVADLPGLEEYRNSPRDTPPAQLLTDIYLPLKSREEARA